MRLFLAVDVPDEVHNYFKSLQEKLDYASFRFPHSFHLTLKFLGEADPEIAERLNFKFDEFTLRTTGIGSFPNAKNTRVIWIGLKNSLSLMNLQNNINLALPEFKDSRNFHPHITLARVSRINDMQKLSRLIESMDVEEKIIPVDKFILYQSILKSTGPDYRKVKEFSASHK